ncbi:hypothetical protein GGI09_000150 [Coemansia sp. S100]|nr:hypothetical protein LPJ71_001951 [Coemansia sp. S17]KAJ2104365.1 hypothetical protein GGI09_000150 [Coemansia sp. S100]KAJ2109730.1 hypothetical protein GGI16_000605 [Coemansia sp. S142-1]KAJ2430479.1 hypothetical protein GGF41_000974 [Coemansia sp. RSA 2531]
MPSIYLSRPRVAVLLILAGLVLTSFILTADRHNYWGAFGDTSQSDNTSEPMIDNTLLNLNTSGSAIDEQLSKKLAIIFPINKNTDMQFYRNTWLREYIYPVCDWEKPGCKIVCNKESTWRTLDEKTFCFSKEMKNYSDKEFFIKLDDDAFIDRDYIFELMRKYTGSEKPVYISHHTRYDDLENKDSLDNVLYGNGKFYMFNFNLVKCLDTNFKYEHHPRNEDAVFGGMVRSGCGEKNVVFVRENDDKIWHKKYKNKNKDLNLAYIKNH